MLSASKLNTFHTFLSIKIIVFIWYFVKFISKYYKFAFIKIANPASHLIFTAKDEEKPT